MEIHDKLIHVLTREDVRLSKQEVKRGCRENIYRLAHFLNALTRAENDPFGLSVGIKDNFCGRVEEILLEVVEKEQTT